MLNQHYNYYMDLLFCFLTSHPWGTAPNTCKVKVTYMERKCITNIPKSQLLGIFPVAIPTLLLERMTPKLRTWFNSHGVDSYACGCLGLVLSIQVVA